MSTEPMNVGAPALEVRNLDVYYGRAHALQDISLTLHSGVLGVVGRNGMGKTTLCNAITGLVPARGSVKLCRPRNSRPFAERDHRARRRLRAAGSTRVAIVIGRRALEACGKKRTPGRVDRRANLFAVPAAGGSPAQRRRRTIGRRAADARDRPRVAIQSARAGDGRADRGPGAGDRRASRSNTEAARAYDFRSNRHCGFADRTKHRRRGGRRPTASQSWSTGASHARCRQANLRPTPNCSNDCSACTRPEKKNRNLSFRKSPTTTQLHAYSPYAARTRMLHPQIPSNPATQTVRSFTRWNAQQPDVPLHDRSVRPSLDNAKVSEPEVEAASETASSARSARVFEFPAASNVQRAAYIVGTFDTKGRELFFLKQCIDKLGLRTVTVDLSTSGTTSTANIHPREVARHHPKGESAVFTGDRGSSVSNMAIAFERFLRRPGATSAASCPPAAREEQRSRRRQCARCRSACRR